MKTNDVMFRSDFPGLNLFSRGKVRDIYDFGDTLLIVATDRISAFDVVMNDPIPGKGIILTRMSKFWLESLQGDAWNHMISTDVENFPPACQPYAEQLAGRSMLVRKARPLPAECIVRGYLVGSGWEDYQDTGCVCGIALPSGMKEAEKLPKPIFTPSTKAEKGAHDENISEEKMEMIFREHGFDDFLVSRVKALSLHIYKKAAEYAKQKGIIIADTKLEFGISYARLMLIDEVLTPDSSRFWPVDQYKAGSSPPSFDKQYLRDWLTTSGGKKKTPPPRLPQDVIRKTQRKYYEAEYQLLGPRPDGYFG